MEASPGSIHSHTPHIDYKNDTDRSSSVLNFISKIIKCNKGDFDLQELNDLVSHFTRHRFINVSKPISIKKLKPMSFEQAQQALKNFVKMGTLHKLPEKNLEPMTLPVKFKTGLQSKSGITEETASEQGEVTQRKDTAENQPPSVTAPHTREQLDSVIQEPEEAEEAEFDFPSDPRMLAYVDTHTGDAFLGSAVSQETENELRAHGHTINRVSDRLMEELHSSMITLATTLRDQGFLATPKNATTQKATHAVFMKTVEPPKHTAKVKMPEKQENINVRELTTPELLHQLKTITDKLQTQTARNVDAARKHNKEEVAMQKKERIDRKELHQLELTQSILQEEIRRRMQ